MIKKIFFDFLEAWLSLLKQAKNSPHLKTEIKKEIKKQEKSLEWFLKLALLSEIEKNNSNEKN